MTEKNEFKGAQENIREEIFEFADENLSPIGSGTQLRDRPADATTESAASVSAVTDFGSAGKFPELAAEELPPLRHENRARLLVQAPNRIFLYWSVKGDPFQLIRKVFGDSSAAGYMLVLKLIDLKRGTEAIYRAGQEGEWWFDVEADTEYQAEIGLYAVNRPYVRLIFSNAVRTPRKSPSPVTASAEEWAIPAERFARVLKVSGFAKDAFDVAVAGDEARGSAELTRSAFAKLVPGADASWLAELADDEMRFAMMALASGSPLDHLEGSIGPGLFALLSANSDDLAAEKAARVLNEDLAIELEELEFDEAGPAVFGSSSMSVPRRLKKRLQFPAPISSHRFGGE